jgi:hypothetical protein
MFDSNLIIPSGETKHVLLSQNVDSSYISGGQIRWPFYIVPPVAGASSSSSSSGESSLSHHSSYGRSRDLRFQLIVTIYRRGRLTRNVGFVLSALLHGRLFIVGFGFDFRVTQQICYVPRPFSMPMCLSPVSVERSQDLPVNVSWNWKPREYPGVLMKGILFDQDIEVECKVSHRSRIIITSTTITHLFLSSLYLYVDTIRRVVLLTHGYLEVIPRQRHHPAPPRYDK